MSPRTPRLVAALAITALALAGCSSSSSSTDEHATGIPTGVTRVAADPVEKARPVTPALTATDAAGTTVTVREKPTRIVCITGACDDMLFSLGMRPVGTSTPALLALPEYLGDKSAEITRIPGSFGAEDVEKIAALRPDLVIGLAGVHEGLRPAVSRFAPLWTLRVKTLEDSVTNLRALATLTGRPDEQVATETAFRQALADAAATSRKHGLDKVVALSMFSSGAGRGVNTDSELLGELVGTVFAYPWPSRSADVSTAQAYSTEEILEKNPAVIYVQSFTAGGGKKASEELAEDPAWKRIDAVRSGRVVEVLPALWASGRGPHAMTLVLDQILDGLTG